MLPIALPGIVTGLAPLSTIDYLGITPSLWTVVAGHATFCIVVVFNNVVARLRRSSTSLEEASMDLGADGWQTFRHVTLPSIATALVAGGLLAFALSFDEVVVTLFTAGSQQTLPLYDLQPVPAAEHGRRGERGGGVRDPADRDPGPPGPAPDARHGRHHGR